MVKALFSNVVFAMACATVLPLGLAGCSAGAENHADKDATGKITMPLVTVANGHKYRLKNAFVIVQGPTSTQLIATDDPNETSLSATLSTGNYYAYLSQWSLERADEQGVFAAVRATLVSDYYAYFDIFDGATTTISYRFETDGNIVVVGSGDLNVNVSVTEIPQVCAPLGTTCAAGAWCPPSALTGQALACIAEGTTALGQPCQLPTECVRNASCFDQGSGPICSALCSPAEFGQACSSGGTCKAAGTTYGVCQP